MAKNFHERRNKMSPEAQEKARMLTQKYTAEMPVDELRAARQMTQKHLARLLGTKQLGTAHPTTSLTGQYAANYHTFGGTFALRHGLCIDIHRALDRRVPEFLLHFDVGTHSTQR